MPNGEQQDLFSVEQGVPGRPQYAPYSNTTTSKDAAESMKPHLNKLERQVLDCIKQAASTCYEVSLQTGIRYSSCCARINALGKKHLIEDSGETRETDSGRKAIVWRAT